MYKSKMSNEYYRSIVSGCGKHVMDLQKSGYAVFFVTHTFKNRGYNNLKLHESNRVFHNLKPTKIWNDHNDFYAAICSKLLGSNFDSSGRSLPIAYVFADMSSVPGLHGVWCVQSTLTAKFRELIKNQTLDTLASKKFAGFRDFHIREVTYGAADVASYCGKLLKFNISHVPDDHFWNVYPLAASEGSSSLCEHDKEAEGVSPAPTAPKAKSKKSAKKNRRRHSSLGKGSRRRVASNVGA